jgi:hypothetical protein
MDFGSKKQGFLGFFHSVFVHESLLKTIVSAKNFDNLDYKSVDFFANTQTIARRKSALTQLGRSNAPLTVV